jgi:hypothetical protein
MPLYPCRYDGNGFVILPAFQQEADARFVVGQVYRIAVEEERSAKSHDHFFASLLEAWTQLPEARLQEFPSVEHLRKRALIMTGWRDESTIVCSSKAEALRLAAFIRPLDEFSVVVVREATVTRLTAKSQSHKAMGRVPFQESKQAVLDYVADLIGVAPEALSSQAGRSA